MRRTRLAIFALFWMGWVVVIPFAHHEGEFVHHPERGAQFRVQAEHAECVACHWESSAGTAQLTAVPQATPVLADAETCLHPTLLPQELFAVCHSTRAPPLM